MTDDKIKLLSIEQYNKARDAGFSAEELIDKTQEWYHKNKAEYQFDNIEGYGPITQKQIDYILKHQDVLRKLIENNIITKAH